MTQHRLGSNQGVLDMSKSLHVHACILLVLIQGVSGASAMLYIRKQHAQLIANSVYIASNLASIEQT